MHNMVDPSLTQRSQERRVLELLASLSYRSGELSMYLRQIAGGVSQLVNVDWSVVTLCADGAGQILGSSIDLGEESDSYDTHGTVSNNVLITGKPFVVEDAVASPEAGAFDPGYRAYLGVPLRSPQGVILGTVCSFHREPRQFSDDDIRIAELFAERAATAIDNYQLYQQQCQFNEALEAEVAKRTQELQTAQAKLVDRERLAAIGEFAAMIIHEIRNPLMTMLMGLHYFKRSEHSPPAQERLALALSEADRLERLLREILLYAKPQVLHLEELEINQWTQELLPELETIVHASGQKLNLVVAAHPLTVQGDRDKLKQVFINLIHNACEAINHNKLITCSVVSNQADGVSIQVHNVGEPIAPNLLPHLFEPFFTTKATGTGLGLAIVKRIIDAHGGKLQVHSSIEQGTIASVYLPLHVNPSA